MGEKNDGGPAFPRSGQFDIDVWRNEKDGVVTEPQSGMTLRDYFAAHAPEIPSGFEYELPGMPKENQKWRFCNNCRSEGICTGEADCEKIQAHRKSVEAHIMRQGVVREIVWRWHYADMMLAEREK